MKRFCMLAGVLALGAALLACFPAAQAGGKKDVVEAGKGGDDARSSDWVALFNGKDLTGWKTHPGDKARWEVIDGAIVGQGPVGHLYSERGDYENFVFRVEAKINDKGNSGQYFRANFAQ